MELSYRVLLVLGFFYSVGASPEFDAVRLSALEGSLKQAVEVYGPTDNAPSLQIGSLVCSDPFDSNTKITIVTGNAFVTINPIERPFANVFLKPLDYEKIVEDQSSQNDRKIHFKCTSSNGETSFETEIFVIDINDNVPEFERQNVSYQAEIDEYLNPAEIPKIIYDQNSRAPMIVTDRDGADNNIVEAECLKMILGSGGDKPCTDYFGIVAVPAGLGRYIFNISALRSNYSEEASYTLQIRAKNLPIEVTYNTQYSNTQNFPINIKDVQNMPPTILKDSLSKVMSEGLQPGQQLVGFITAFDQDVRDPHPIRYELFPPDDRSSYAFDNKFFTLGSVFEEDNLYKVPLVLNKTVNREEVADRSKTLYLGIKAIEYDPLNRPNRQKGTASETISINIEDVNDVVPEFGFTTYNFVVTELSGNDANPENFQQISSNLEIEVTDTDSPLYNQFTVDIISGNTDSNFRLDLTKGSEREIINLYAKRKILDYETDPNLYVLQLLAVDSDNPSFFSTATVSIQINNTNDHGPKFDRASAAFNVKENSTLGYRVGQVIATDKDRGQFGIIERYEILFNDSNSFSIDDNGIIYLDAVLDAERRYTYNFIVSAYDIGKREGSINVVIQVINVYDVGHEFVSTYTATLVEDERILEPEIIVRAVSRDSGSPLMEYFIERVLPPTISQNAFSLDRLSGELTVVQFIDYNDTSPTEPGIVRVNVTARAGGISKSTIVTIVIIDVNNYAPVFVPQVPNNVYYTSITESARPDIILKCCRSFKQTSWILIRLWGCAGSSGFMLSANTLCDIVFDLDVTDGDGPFNPNGQVAFQVQSGADEDFSITGDSGVILVSNSPNLDRQTNKINYTIVVLARDSGQPPKSAFATVIVTVLDSNNKNPVFDSPIYRFGVEAGKPVGSPIGEVRATDVDFDSRIEYTIDYPGVEFLKQNQGVPQIDARKVIRIGETSGMIEVAGEINREVFERIKLTVIAEDLNAETEVQQTATASVTIFVNAPVDDRIYFTNDKWTRTEPYINVTFTESRSINYQIVALRAIDPSVPETVKFYRKVPGSDIGDYFNVNNANVFVKKALDYESITAADRKLSLVVEALSEDRSKTGTASIFLTVQDLNDNAPVFKIPDDGYRFIVAEDKKANAKVGIVTATDKDSASYGQVEYSIYGNQTDFVIFTEQSGNERVGVIRVAKGANLDFEANQIYDLVVIATDNPGGVNSVRFATNIDVVIEIDDRNDMSPVFDEPVYNITIIGTPNQEILRIKATDGDSGDNGRVNYAITNATQTVRNYFAIDTVDQSSNANEDSLRVGRLYVRSSLDMIPDRTMFELTVTAIDSGNPQRSGTCKVIITVSKGVQDLKPKWPPGLRARVEIPENEPRNTFVAQLRAIPGTDINTPIIYSFISSGDDFRDYASFTINNNTGEIRTGVKLDYEEQIIYSLLILATDSMNDTYNNQFLMIVEVLDVDDNQPSFVTCPDKKYTIPELAYVNEELPMDVFVYRVQACDLDDDPFNKVKYSWFIDNNNCADNTQTFRLDVDNGQIYTKMALDRERVAEYTLCVEASRPNVANPERDLNQLNATNKLLFLRVVVRDMNDEGPKFFEPSVKTVILQYPLVDISVAEAYDPDLPPNDGIRYSIDNIDFTVVRKTQNAPTAFTINANDGTIAIGTNDYTDYIGGYFDITVKAEDYNGANVPYDHQLQRVYVTDRANRVRVVFNKPADEVVSKDANDMIKELNDLYGDSGMYYEIESISYHVVSSNADPSFDKTDVCLVVVDNDRVLSSVAAVQRLTEVQKIRGILSKYGAVDPGSCDPAVSVYPVGWESYWWVLVAFAIFIFVCCLILIVLICILYRQYKQYMDSRKTYLVPGN